MQYYIYSKKAKRIVLIHILISLLVIIAITSIHFNMSRIWRVLEKHYELCA